MLAVANPDILTCFTNHRKLVIISIPCLTLSRLYPKANGDVQNAPAFRIFEVRDWLH